MPKGEQPSESEFYHLDRSADESPLKQAWLEAFYRVLDTRDGRELTKFTSNNSGPEGLAAIQEYLSTNRDKLSPEAVFFLQTTIELRKERTKRGGES